MAYKRISPMPIIEGGTNASSFATVDGTTYFDGTRLVVTATGNAGQVLTSNGAAAAPTYQTPAPLATRLINITCGSWDTNTGTISWISFYALGSSLVQANAQFPIPVDTVFSNLYVYIGINANINTSTHTIMVNGVATAISVSIPAMTTGTFTDMTHSVFVNAGDLVQLQVNSSGPVIYTGSITIQSS